MAIVRPFGAQTEYARYHGPMMAVTLPIPARHCVQLALLVGLPWPVLALDTTLPVVLVQVPQQTLALAQVVDAGASTAGGAAAPSTDARAKAEPVTLEASRDYLIGVTASTSLDGSPSLKLRPMLAFQLGRVRVSTGGASTLLSLGRNPVDPGLSAAWLQNDRWSVSTALRLQRGRSSGNDPLLQGLPDVPNTIIGRLSVNYTLHARWVVGVSAAQDLLGNQIGLRINTRLRYRHPVSERTYWETGLGTSAGNRTYMQTHFGIASTDAARTGRAAYLPHSGLESVSLGWTITRVVNHNWVAFAGLSASQLQGQAARSPLVTGRTSYGASVGIAYRSGH